MCACSEYSILIPYTFRHTNIRLNPPSSILLRHIASSLEGFLTDDPPLCQMSECDRWTRFGTTQAITLRVLLLVLLVKACCLRVGMCDEHLTGTGFFGRFVSTGAIRFGFCIIHGMDGLRWSTPHCACLYSCGCLGCFVV